MELFSKWENLTGNRPTVEVRKLGWVIERAYLEAMGASPRIVENIYKDVDPERQGRWDKIAEATLNYLGSEENTSIADIWQRSWMSDNLAEHDDPCGEAAEQVKRDLSEYCGDPDDPLCGPDMGKPWCAYHGGTENQ